VVTCKIKLRKIGWRYKKEGSIAAVSNQPLLTCNNISSQYYNYCYIIMLALSLNFLKAQPVTAPKIAVDDNLTVV